MTNTPPLALSEAIVPLGGGPGREAAKPGPLRRRYVQVETDEGITGLSATMAERNASYVIVNVLRDLLVGEILWRRRLFGRRCIRLWFMIGRELG